MNTESIKAAYRDALKETIIVRRYTGAGSSRPKFDVVVRGKARLYGATELVGTVQQGDQNVLVLVEDLIAKGFTLPLINSDKLVVAGRELAILQPNTRKAEDGTIVVYDCQARG